MALPATHVRFALLAARGLPIRVRRHFLSGTLYPDSRWLSGLPRERTHPEAPVTATGHASDFRLGWQAHLECDRIQAQLCRRQLPELERMPADASWRTLAAVKMLQDAEDVRHIDMAASLPGLMAVETPNGEDKRAIEAYFDAVREAYADGTPPGRAAYRRLWLRVGLDPETADAVMALRDRMIADERIIRITAGLFTAMAGAAGNER